MRPFKRSNDIMGSFGVMEALLSVAIVTVGVLAIIASAQSFQTSLDDDDVDFKWESDPSNGIELTGDLEDLMEQGERAGMTSLVIKEFDGASITLIEGAGVATDYRSYPAPIIHSDGDIRAGLLIAGW